MKLTTLSVVLSSPAVACAAPYGGDNSSDYLQRKATRQMDFWQLQYNGYMDGVLHSRQSGCTPDNLLYRKEWGALTKEERLGYIGAVKKLMELPSRSPPDQVPGARSRYDDFIATHMQYATAIHHSVGCPQNSSRWFFKLITWCLQGLFLTWHRYFTYLYELALRDEAGYKGAHPYWDWTQTWQDWRKSTVFDGSPYSMGSNGKAIPHGPVNDTALGSTRLLYPGTGGGCIESGPFANLTIHLGPVALLPAGKNNGFNYNPRCLIRDISPEWSKNAKPTDVVNVISAYSDFQSFDIGLEGLNGLHAAGHFGVGGMMADQYASPCDPAFFLHHGMIDRVWTLWQSQDAHNRTYQTGRTVTAHNNPPSANATLDTIMDFGILAPKQRLGDLVSTVDGPFCYQYL
ncbi:hypothetical protein BFJ69_g3279 [Fusarium oxysporum]|uniref:Tyrosinase copper-binding domain-containing protein n=1 Tax=Fusarium oxysporum TaxID=5507 RepID=A0A420NQ09_FUSOX|nr:hypothetical protein BFJ69_g3279 [Fusarium oxysporum]